MHRLAEVDLEAKTAVCQICGPVDIRVKKKADGSPRPRCAELMRKQGREYAKTEKGKTATKSRRQRNDRGEHGLTYAEAREFRDEHGCCEICKRTAYLVVDHDHETGNLRGVLCRRCNLGIGYFKDSPALLRIAAIYLESRE